MSKIQRFFILAFAMIGLGTMATVAIRAADQKPSGSEDFFVISSIDRTKHVLVLLQPTEVTEAMAFTDKTQFFDDNGKALKITDFRAGQTVFITNHRQADGSFVADRVRKGYMTVAEMRRRYVPFLPQAADRTTSQGNH